MSSCRKCIHHLVCAVYAPNFDDVIANGENCSQYISSVSVAEIRYGKWKLNKDGSGTCNQCGRTAKNVWDYDNYQNYCGHCGAKMSI